MFDPFERALIILDRRKYRAKEFEQHNQTC